MKPTHKPMQQNRAIYLDHNSATEPHSTVRAFLKTLADQAGTPLGNPSSIHAHGQASKRLINEAREQVARSLGNPAHEQLIFTSSGTEANQLAIRSALSRARGESAGPNWVLSAIEHKSVLDLKNEFVDTGGDVRTLPTSSDGRIQMDRLTDFVDSGSALVSVIWVGNETGVISDVAPLLEVKRRYPDTWIHVDAAQAWGKTPIDFGSLGIDSLSLSPYKIGGLPGTGVLCLAPGRSLKSLILGHQELGRRGGTENLLSIVAAGLAAQATAPEDYDETLRPLRDRFESLVRAEIPDVRINGAEAPRVANTSNLSFTGVQGESLVMSLDLEGFSVSAGSACASGLLEPSHVLLAMGLPQGEAMAAVRVSIGRTTRWEDLEAFAKVLRLIVERQRRKSDSYGR